MAYVYRHIRVDKDEPFYIGIGSDKNYKRAYNVKNRNIYWKNIVNKTDYLVDIMIDNLTWENACKSEIYFINLYGKKPNGILCNMTDGGGGILGLKRGIEFCIKNSKNNKGKILSEISKKKISDSHKGKILTKEHRENISLSTKGKKLKEEHKRKIGEANSSIKHGNWHGYIHQFDKNGVFLNKFDTLHIAMEKTGVDYRDISKVCSYYDYKEKNKIYSYKKNHISAGKFIWKRI
jgi:hypothetical protein